jgi:xanthine dehydrogenase YagS FAD-binding subunit
MQPLRYRKASDEAGAIVALAAEPNAAFVAGGTTLVDLMKLGVMTPATLVDVNALPLAKIEFSDGGVRIGAMVRNSDLGYHKEIVARYPLLSEALLAGASPQLRNMATVGGNLMQRTRCSYFRDLSTACNKRKPGSGCAALDGDHRMHAVLGTSEQCIAAHPSDMCVAMAALDAVVHARGPKGERQIAFADFHVEPGQHPERETTLMPDELIVAVTLPSAHGWSQSRYVKVRDRASYAFALASVGARLRIEGGVVKDARIALGGVGTRPWRAVDAEQALVGKRPDRDAFAHAAEVALRNARPRRDNAFKVVLARRAIVRALSTVHGAA